MASEKLNNQYRELLLDLLPDGRAWDKTESSNLSSVVGALSKEFAEIHELAESLPKEMTALYTESFLTEWEQALQTQEDCKEIDNTIDGRRNAVLAKLRSTGGVTIKYLEDIAKTLGFPVTITDKFGSFKVGSSKVGDPLAGDAWRTVFQVRAPETTTRYFKVGSSKVGEPLASFGNELLECTIKRLKLAGKIPLFLYYTIVHNASSSVNAVVSAQATMNQVRFLAANISGDVAGGIFDIWKPSALEDSVLWLDAKDFSSGGAIALWSDKSKATQYNANNAVQDESANQPDVILDALNSRPVVRFAQGDEMDITFSPDLDVSKNLDVFIAGAFTNQGLVLNRGQYDVQLGSTLQSKALTNSWHHRSFGVSSGGGNGNICLRYNDRLVLANTFGLFYSTDEGESWTEVLDDQGDSCTCRGSSGAFEFFDNKVWFNGNSVQKIYSWDGASASATVYDVSGTNCWGVGASVFMSAFAVYDGELYVAGGQDTRVAKFNSGAGTWSVVMDTGLGDSGAGYIRGMCADSNYLYFALEGAGNSDIYRWDGATLTALSTSILNPSVVWIAEGTLWVLAQDGKMYNLATGWGTYITVPNGYAKNPEAFALLKDDESVMLADDPGGSPNVGAVIYEFDGTTLDVNNFISFIEGAQADHLFYDSVNDEVLRGTNSGTVAQVIQKNARLQDSDSVPSTAIFHFSFYDTRMAIRINGTQVAELRFDATVDSGEGNENYRNERTLLEAIDVTSGLVTIVDDLVTINPSSDLPELGLIEVDIPNNVITGWAGVDDWYFETGES